MKESQKPPDVPLRNAPLVPQINPVPKRSQETGGPKGLEPTRYGDWEKNGKCVDF